MGTDTDSETTNPEIKPLAEFDPGKEQAPDLDERDVIEPFKKIAVATADDLQDDPPASADDEDTGEQEIALDEMNDPAESLEPDTRDDQGDETEIRLDPTDEKPDDESAMDDSRKLDTDKAEADFESAPEESSSGEGDVPEDDTKVSDKEAAATEDPQAHDPAEVESEPDSEETDGAASEPLSSDDEASSAKDSPKAPSANGDENDFVALNDDEVSDETDAGSRAVEAADDGEQKQEDLKQDQTAKKAASIVKKPEALPKSKGQNQRTEKPAKDGSASKKIVMSAFIMLVVAGAVIYSKPAQLGVKGKPQEAEPAPTKMEEPVKHPTTQAQQQPSGKNDRYQPTLAEASRLRDELLAKREEIYRLKLHYRNGIDALKEQIYREVQAANISTDEEALQNKRIELNLRTIQRRQVYIEELEKPDQWAHRGSEELLFLIRKTLIDLEMADIAGGVDLDRHMRYINAAIQKYQPSADKLAIDPPPVKQTPLETIWTQIRNQQSENIQASVGEKNENIIAEICSGDFTRVTQLTAITPEAAKCLARSDGSELFLNGLAHLTAKEAEYLFKWRGNWVCLNGVKKLSPAAAKYLFNWEGNWISLNGLTELPPELALYLTEWKGSQLELMGLDHEKAKQDERALKYLALWETMGGKLFISDAVRNEMKQIM